VIFVIVANTKSEKIETIGAFILFFAGGMLKRCLILEPNLFLSQEARKMSFNDDCSSYDEGYWKACHPTGCCGPEEYCHCYDDRDDEDYDDRDEGDHDDWYAVYNDSSPEQPKAPVRVRRAKFGFKTNHAAVEAWFAKRMQ